MLKLEVDIKTEKGFVEGDVDGYEDLMNEACNAIRSIIEYVAKATEQTSEIEKGAVALTLFQCSTEDLFEEIDE